MGDHPITGTDAASPMANQPEHIMADINVRHDDTEPTRDDDYTVGDLIFWIVGVLMIPLIPILCILLFTPQSGM